jgi:hypothetical protein
MMTVPDLFALLHASSDTGQLALTVLYGLWYADDEDHEESAMSKTETASRTSEAAIFARLWETENGRLSPELARHVLRLSFSEEDKARLHELAVKNQEGRILHQERDELDSYIKVGDLLAILQSKARQLLKKSG